MLKKGKQQSMDLGDWCLSNEIVFATVWYNGATCVSLRRWQRC